MNVISSSGVSSPQQGGYTPQVENAPQTTSPGVKKAPETVTPVVTKAESDAKKDNKEQQSSEASQETIRKAVSDINKRANGTEAIFGIHDKTNRLTIKIVDKETRDVIKELPAEKTLDLIAKAWEMAGLMVDEKR